MAMIDKDPHDFYALRELMLSAAHLNDMDELALGAEAKHFAYNSKTVKEDKTGIFMPSASMPAPLAEHPPSSWPMISRSTCALANSGTTKIRSLPSSDAASSLLIISGVMQSVPGYLYTLIN